MATDVGAFAKVTVDLVPVLIAEERQGHVPDRGGHVVD